MDDIRQRVFFFKISTISTDFFFKIVFHFYNDIANKFSFLGIKFSKNLFYGRIELKFSKIQIYNIYASIGYFISCF